MGLHRRLHRLRTEKKIVLRHQLAEKKEEAELAKKMRVLKALGVRKLNRERSDLIKAVARLKHEKRVDATKLRAEEQRVVIINRHALREARNAANTARAATILSKGLKVFSKKN